MLALLKIYLNIIGTDQDTLLNAVLDSAVAQFEDITHTEYDDDNSNMQDIVVQMAVIRYHRLGVEGTTSQSFSGATEQYCDGFPKELNRRIWKYKKVQMR